jgi:hypothetical protein
MKINEGTVKTFIQHNNVSRCSDLYQRWKFDYFIHTTDIFERKVQMLERLLSRDAL